MCAGHLLSEALLEYWPGVGNNEIGKRNISINLSVAGRGCDGDGVERIPVARGNVSTASEMAS